MIHAFRVVASRRSALGLETPPLMTPKSGETRKAEAVAVLPKVEDDGKKVYVEVRRFVSTLLKDALLASYEADLADRESYEVWHHECYHDEGKSCLKPWELLASKGR